MVPQWGGPMAQIGAAVGQGAEAVGRAKQQDTVNQQKDRALDIEEKKANKIGLGRKGASASSGSKKLKTPAQQFAQNLSPEAALFFQARMKQMNKLLEPDDEGNTPDASGVFDSIMADTRKVDSRARMGRGQLKAEEIPDADVVKAAADPNLETRMLTWVGADPTQRQLMMARLQNARAKASGGTSAKPNG